MPLLKKFSISVRADCDEILRQISLTNKKLEELHVSNCTGFTFSLSHRQLFFFFLLIKFFLVSLSSCGPVLTKLRARRTHFGLGSKNSARLKSFYPVSFSFFPSCSRFPLPCLSYISKYTELFVIIKIGKNTVGKWNNGERENSLATCQAKKKKKERERASVVTIS